MYLITGNIWLLSWLLVRLYAQGLCHARAEHMHVGDRQNTPSRLITEHRAGLTLQHCGTTDT
jgi:hypothetical protein